MMPSLVNHASNRRNQASTGISADRLNFGSSGLVTGLLAIALAQAGNSSALGPVTGASGFALTVVAEAEGAVVEAAGAGALKLEL